MSVFAPRLIGVLALALFFAAPVLAQDPPPKGDGWLPPVKNGEWLPQGWEKSIPLPSDTTGEPIKEDQRIWAYAAAVGGFLLVFVLTRAAVRVIAYILIALIVIGSIGLLCNLINEGYLKTWPALLKTTAAIAVSSGLTCAVIGLFTIKQDGDGT